MNEKARAISGKLSAELPGVAVSYRVVFDTGHHEFRLDFADRPSCWLYLGAEFFDDRESVILLNFLNIYNVVDTFRRSKDECRLFLGRDGLKDVGPDFGS